MSRNALRSLFRNLLLASLPAAGCNHDALPLDLEDMAPSCTPIASFDMARAHGVDIFYTLVDGAYPEGSDSDNAVCLKVCTPYGGCTRIETRCAQTVFLCCCGPGVGRLPAGLEASKVDRDPASPANSEEGSYWAEVAYLESASVFAFRALAAELRAHGAPTRLVARAERAVGEEVRHARMTRHLARRAGATVAAVVVSAPPVRALAAIALENAVEGCVRETWGALLAHYQARCVTDSALGRALRRIAGDETGHAELAWAVADWAEPRLSSVERYHVTAARRSSFEALVRNTTAIPATPSLRKAVGLPSSRVARRMAAGLAAALG